MSLNTRSRGYLPHLESQNPIYFVTFRLADSLPRDLLDRLRHERQLLDQASLSSAGFQPASSPQPSLTVSPSAGHKRHEKLRALLRKTGQYLDSGLGQCHMHDPRVAETVANALQQFHGQRYRLLAWCVMPNHVHVVFSPLGHHQLQAILHTWKSFSAKEANSLLGRTGHFWQREYFDHLVRSQSSLAKIINYVKHNPEKAGLKDWRWVSVMP